MTFPTHFLLTWLPFSYCYFCFHSSCLKIWSWSALVLLNFDELILSSRSFISREYRQVYTITKEQRLLCRNVKRKQKKLNSDFHVVRNN